MKKVTLFIIALIVLIFITSTVALANDFGPDVCKTPPSPTPAPIPYPSLP